jgi:UrcA family protein
MNTHSQRNRTQLLANALAVLMAAGIAQAQAGQDEVMRVSENRDATSSPVPQVRQGAESRSVTVRYGDLNLNRTAGAKTLYVRLTSAARSVCAPSQTRDLAAHRDWNSCFSEALDAAVAETGSHALASLHQERTGRAVFNQVASAD